MSETGYPITIEEFVWHLEMRDPSKLKPGRKPEGDLLLIRAEIVSPELGRFLYTSVGGDWYWTFRIDWSWDQWQAWLSRPGVETWMLLVSGTPAGYFVLDGEQPGEVEIANFGLMPQFTGQGLGGYLLGETIAKSWSLAARWPGFEAINRVWVHTCSLDGPQALRNYQARGLEIFQTDVSMRTLTVPTPGPWPGAHRKSE